MNRIHRIGRADMAPPLLRISMTILIVIVLSAAENRALAIDIDTMFQSDPLFLEVQETILPLPSRQQTWLQALAHSEVELQVKAAEAIALAHQRGDHTMREVIPQLISALDPDDAHPLVRLAVVRALIVLDARMAADQLMNQSQREGPTKPDMAELVEPALAAWGHPPMQKIWLERLDGSRPTGSLFMLAIRAAASTKLTESVPRLRALVLNRELTPEIRLESARALASIQLEGLEPAALQILDSRAANSRIESLLAATLLKHHSSPAAVSLLQELAAYPEPAVIAIALQRLSELDPMLIESMNTRISAHSDTKIRQLTVQILRGQQTLSAVTLLGGMLNDIHPTVRKQAQESLIILDQVDRLRPAVREAAMRMLATDQFRGLEQAALFVGGVDHEPAAARLVELLDSTHPQVAIAAAWALRRLLIPETAQPIFETLKRQTEKYPHFPPNPEWNEKLVAGLYKQRGHLIEALALMHHRDAVPLLVAYLPTPPKPPGVYAEVDELRVQAIWALGHIFQDDPQPEIVARLTERMKTPDDSLVRGRLLIQAMAAVSLGRMKSVDSITLMRSRYAPADKYSDLKYGCAWGIQRVTNEPLPEFDMIRTKGQPSSFLDPLDE